MPFALGIIVGAAGTIVLSMLAAINADSKKEEEKKSKKKD